MYRYSIIIITWAAFTVFLGLIDLIARAISHSPWSFFELYLITSTGGLFAASAVIASDATGRLIRRFYLYFKGHARKPKHIGFSLVGLIVSVICLCLTAMYYMRMLEFLENPGTEIPMELARYSVIWFSCTLTGALPAVICEAV